MKFEALKTAAKEQKEINSLQNKIDNKREDKKMLLLQFIQQNNLKAGNFLLDNRNNKKVILLFVATNIGNLKILARYVDAPADSIQLLDYDYASKKYFIEHFTPTDI